MEAKETYALILIVLIVFAGAFYMITSQARQATVDGVSVYYTGNLKEALKNAVDKQPLLIEEELVNATDRKNSAVQAMTVEIAYALSANGKPLQVYGTVDGRPEVNCNENTTNCSGASITVRVGQCNCVRLSNGRAEVEGSYEFLTNATTLITVRKLFATAAVTSYSEPRK